MINAVIVDDEKLTRKGFIEMGNWPDYGIRIVGEAKDGHSALALLDKQEVDLLFVDIGMPGMSGFELMEQVRSRHPRIKSVVLTCYHEFDYVQEALRLGAIDYVVKTLLNSSNVDETMSRIVKRLCRETAQAPATRTGQRFPGALVFLCPDRSAVRHAWPDDRTAERQPFPLGGGMWMTTLGDSDEHESISELAGHMPAGWRIVQAAPSDQLSRDEAQAVIAERLCPHLFYDFAGEPIVNVRLEELPGRPDPEVLKANAEELRSQWESMRWPLFGKDWQRFIERIEMTRPDPAFLLELAKPLVDNRSIYFGPGAGDSGPQTPEEKPHSWPQIKRRLADLALSLQQRTADLSLSREVVVCLLQAMGYMWTNAGSDLKQADVARRIGMGRSYFSQCYKKFTGLSFGETLRMIRIEHAKLLLLHSELSVYEIASRVGFEDDKHFSRLFRERSGLYPTEFRARR